LQWLIYCRLDQKKGWREIKTLEAGTVPVNQGGEKRMREAVIVNALRTAVGKAPRGSLKDAAR
jgi:hypothetical protein